MKERLNKGCHFDEYARKNLMEQQISPIVEMTVKTKSVYFKGDFSFPINRDRLFFVEMAIKTCRLPDSYINKIQIHSAFIQTISYLIPSRSLKKSA